MLRGKVSEGLDFADAAGRAVVITGIPFAPLADAKVMLKRQALLWPPIIRFDSLSTSHSISYNALHHAITRRA